MYKVYIDKLFEQDQYFIRFVIKFEIYKGIGLFLENLIEVELCVKENNLIIIFIFRFLKKKYFLRKQLIICDLWQLMYEK